MTVDLGLTADQEAIAELFDGFFAKEAPPSVARDAEPLGFDRGLWAKVVELGAPGMGSAEAVGGGGASLADLVVVAEAVGRSIAPVPLVDHLAALTVLDDEDLVAGEAIAAVSVRPADAEGNWWLVPAGAVADVVVGVDGDELVAVRSAAPMAGPHNHASAPMADRSARDGERRVLGPAADFQAVIDRWKVLTAASLIGISDGALRLGLDYVMERQQFGVPIGAFQAVQHGLADLPVLVEGGRLLTHKAAWAIGAGTDSLDWRDPRRQRRLGPGGDGLRVRQRGGGPRHRSQPPLPRRLRLRRGVRHPAVLPTGPWLVARVHRHHHRVPGAR